ncbi:DUF1963 domain-containing protein [Pedobacter caeni]|uniref:Leucine rich repeat-containing protein n=1 Tax=Pedobacter caeni TaxID=288992 RepID=A0A1M4W9D7_9SPHI|nr:DUF1963 domain-containing protein [Pedobacter caeni]SHE77770.1 Leucine rich repeat-containing protein [Pedobacter caeni]
METIPAKTFQININPPFKHTQTMWECIRAEHNYGDYGDDDIATITVALYENKYYDKFKGKDFEECFYNCCKERRGELEIIEDKTITVAGGSSYIRMAKSSYGYFYYFGVLKISEAYSYDFVGDCEAGQYKKYIPLFEETWKSLQYFGGQVTAMEEQNKGLDALFKTAALAPLETEEEQNAEIPEIKDFQIPADQQEEFKIDHVSFDFLEGSSCSIHSTGNTGDQLSLYLQAAIPNYQKYGHILNDYDDGVVYFRFDLRDIYQKGIPTGKFSIEKDREERNMVSLWKGGFHYSLSLFGELTLKEGWVGFNGYFRDFMETKVYAVSLAKKISLADLKWEHYRFSSLTEASTAAPQTVRHLQLNNLAASKLPDEIFNYTQLESLNIFYDNGFSGLRLEEIPADIYRLGKLKDLSFYWIDLVKVIPEEIGALKALRSLGIVGSQAKTLPSMALELPDLEFCTLSNNQLEAIPDQLPSSLKSLYLQKNQLKALPASLVSLSKLRWLNITDNPFESLPSGIEYIEYLELELEKKQALLDYEYKGADGLGTISFDNECFSAMTSRDLKYNLSHSIAEAELEEYKKGLELLALWSVALETTKPDDYSRKGNCRFGGLPDLPKDMAYPTFTTYHNDVLGYQFIAQLNCEELSTFQSFLPRKGILYFFITDQEDFSAKVIYAETELSDLQSAKDLDVNEDFIYDDHGIFHPFMVKADKYAGMPSFYSDEHLYHGDAENLTDLEEGDYDLIDKFRSGLHPDQVKPVHSINSYVFKQHGSPQIEAASKLKGQPQDYMVLLRVSSDQNPGFCFWDSGEIYFVIHKSDLAKADFSNIFCSLETS